MEKSQHSVSGARERSAQQAAKEGGAAAGGWGGKVARMRVWGMERWCWRRRVRGREEGRRGRRCGRRDV